MEILSICHRLRTDIPFPVIFLCNGQIASISPQIYPMQRVHELHIKFSLFGSALGMFIECARNQYHCLFRPCSQVMFTFDVRSKFAPVKYVSSSFSLNQKSFPYMREIIVSHFPSLLRPYADST